MFLKRVMFVQKALFQTAGDSLNKCYSNKQTKHI